MREQSKILAALLMVMLALPVASRALDAFPLEPTVDRVRATLEAQPIENTGLERSNYLEVIAGIAGYFQHFQNQEGRIIDPFMHKEFQYSTPCYAWAAASLVASGKQTNLLESAALALDASLEELATGKAADSHGDFFTFPSMLAYEQLRDRVTRKRRKHWEALLRAIDPDRSYADRIKPKRDDVHNWNIVALSGEFLRHQDGFTGLDYVEFYLGKQMKHFTANGMYEDPNLPMAYDHFPRHFLSVMLQRGYAGEYSAQIEELSQRAAWVSLLMQSPNGELPTGGRSSEHQWNEAMQCVTYEVWAAREQSAGDVVAARAFKRAAHLALRSVQHWVRPSGELWIVKNRFDPAVRHGYMGYSSHSQYNLLAASMLATAWLMADDNIGEGASPADTGGFAFELPEFHKVFANAGGLYVELDTDADPGYNGTGLIRIQRGGVDPFVGPTDTPPIVNGALNTGISWREGDHWQSLAGLGKENIKDVTFMSLQETPAHVRFLVSYEIGRPGVPAVIETYDLTPEQLRVTAQVGGETNQVRVRFPAMAFDGQNAATISVKDATATVTLLDSRETFHVESPANVQLQRTGEWDFSRNGYLEEIWGDVPGSSVTFTLQPQTQKSLAKPAH